MIIFFKLLKWLVSTSFMICAIYFLDLLVNTENPNFMAPVLITFAVVFWMSKSTYEGDKKTFIAILVVLTTTGLLAFAANIFYVSYNYPEIGFYKIWWAMNAVCGIPFMIIAFNKED